MVIVMSDSKVIDIYPPLIFILQQRQWHFSILHGRQRWLLLFCAGSATPGTLRKMLGIWHFAEKLQK
jgi:hypothetical protein